MAIWSRIKTQKKLKIIGEVAVRCKGAFVHMLQFRLDTRSLFVGLGLV